MHYSYSGQVSGMIACGFAAVINRITTVFPVALLLSLPTELVQAYLDAISQLTQSFLEIAMRNEDVSLICFQVVFCCIFFMLYMTLFSCVTPGCRFNPPPITFYNIRYT